jgi:predicted transcriptional regulator
MIEEETLLELSQIADERNVSASQVVREALAKYVPVARSEQRSVRPLSSFIGSGEGPTDLSERAEELVAHLTDLESGWD